MPFSKLQNVWDIFVWVFFLLLSQFEKQLSEVGALTQKATILLVVSQPVLTSYLVPTVY